MWCHHMHQNVLFRQYDWHGGRGEIFQCRHPDLQPKFSKGLTQVTFFCDFHLRLVMDPFVWGLSARIPLSIKYDLGFDTRQVRVTPT